MAKQMDKIIGAFKNVIQNSSPVSGTILNPIGSTVNILSTWSQRNVERKVNVQSELTQVLNIDSTEVNTIISRDISSELLPSYSPSNTYRGLFRDIPPSGKAQKKQHLEIWKKNRLWKVYDLASYELHGDVYTDSEFGCFQWSPCETKILYVAEKKQAKAEPFLPTKPTEKSDDECKKGCEYELAEDWGEQLVGKCSPVLCVCDLETDTISVLSGIPKEMSIGQGVWAPGGGVVGVAWTTLPRRLGLVYCTNRDSFIFHLTQDFQFNKLTAVNGKSVRSPKFNGDGSRLVWLERNSGGPHHGCHSLILYDWSSGQTKVVVDIVKEQTKTSNGQPFFGLYCQSLGKCWLADKKTIVVSTPQRISVKTYLIDTDTHDITDLCGENGDSYSLSVIDANKDFILCVKSSIDSCPSLVLGRLSEDLTVKWNALLEQEPLISGLNVGVIHFKANYEPDNVSNYSALYMIPKEAKDAPLVVWSHGGPHSSVTNSTSVMAAFFASLGFGMVMVNFRGSTGAGQDSIDFLLGRVGKTDAHDVQQAVEAVLNKFPTQLSPDKCLLFGGSYGGFLSLHLSAQYPSFYKAVSVRNPVADISSILPISDIPDWAATESGLEYNSTFDISSDDFIKMKLLSPLNLVQSVTAPTLFLLGKKDLRVPHYQGLNFYYQLKARGIKTKILMYDDNHSLSQVPHEVDFAINTGIWFLDTIDHSLD